MKTMTYEPDAGTRIESACAAAVYLAKSHSAIVRFKFNDTQLEAKPGTAPEALVEDWRQQTERIAEEYRNSSEGRAAAAQREQEIVTLNSRATALLGRLNRVLALKDQDHLMEWLRSFTPISDDISVKFDTAALAAQFEAAGFKENEGVGQEPEWFNTRSRMAGYIIGQVINCLKRGMPPHPVTVSFIDKYEALPSVLNDQAKTLR